MRAAEVGSDVCPLPFPPMWAWGWGALQPPSQAWLAGGQDRTNRKLTETPGIVGAGDVGPSLSSEFQDSRARGRTMGQEVDRS